MKKARLILTAALATLALTACASSMTSPDTCVDPGGNNFYCE